ncbi:MAG: hypothetical protein HN700_19265 [Verrucomicrobia bacterium]|jgi:hypothetical protein|nr:hypothetical protein [Verrucomicrobiota bacterium]
MKTDVHRGRFEPVLAGRGILAVLWMGICLGLAATSPAALLFSEDFENDTLGQDPDNPPWNAIQEPADGGVVDVSYNTDWPVSSQVGHLADSSTSNTPVRLRAEEIAGMNEDLVTVSFDAYLDYPTVSPGYIFVDLLDADSISNRPVRSVGLAAATGFRSNHWHHFDLIANFTGSATNYITEGSTTNTLNNQKYDLWMDGKRVKVNIGTFPSDYADGLDGLAFVSWTDNETEYVIDNIEIRDTTYVYEDLLGIQTEDEIDDDFGDGDLEANPGGSGHGFVKGDQNTATFNESASESAVRFDITPGGFAKRNVASRDEFPLEAWRRDFAWYMNVVAVSNGTKNIDARILCTVISDDLSQTGAIDAQPWATGEGGIWVSMDLIDAGTSNTVNLYLYASDDSNLPNNNDNHVTLESFSFNQDDGQPLAVFLSLTRESETSQAFHYRLRVTNDSGVVGTTLSGTTDTGINETDLLADELADGVFVAFSVNNRDDGSAAIDLERITVSKVPPFGAVMVIR